MSENILMKELNVVNIGLVRFYDDLKKQGVKSVNLDWRPPASGNKRMLDILSRMKKSK